LIWVPTSFHLSSKNSITSFQKSVPRCIAFSIDFCIVFSSILFRFWRSTWSHVGHFIAQNTAGANEPWVVYVGYSFFVRFMARPGTFFVSFWVYWRPLGLDLGGFGHPFWRFLVPIFFRISKLFAAIFSASLVLC